VAGGDRDLSGQVPGTFHSLIVEWER
jgi:hypothetical protein